MTHPPRELLYAFTQGRVALEESARIEAHLQECLACLAALESAPRDDLEALLHTAGQSTAPASPAPTLSQNPVCLPQVPGYEVLEEIGRGGMGVVYKARQVGLRRLVALKVLLAGGHADPAQLARFRAEGEAIGRLRHAHIVQVHDSGMWDGLPYFAMEYVEGGSLADRLHAGPQPPREAAALIAALALAMELAHQTGIIHRDLKPANILMADDGTPKIADFGLARRMQPGGGLTQSGTVAGTPSYMAPEQAAGRTHEVGPAADLYALGAVLYELLTGRPPFQGSTPVETLDQVLHADPVPPRQLVPRLPRDLETICLKCLEKDPRRRYASADDLAADLTRFLQGMPVRARRVSLPARMGRWARRRPAVASLLTLVLLLAGGGFAGVFSQWRIAVAKEQEAEQLRTQAVQERDTARHHLYQALFREAQAIRLARQPGYRQQAWHRLRQALELDVPNKDLDTIRHEAAASLGDFLGREPIAWADFPTAVSSFAFDPHDTMLALGLRDGSVMVRSLSNGAVTARLRPAQASSGMGYVTFTRADHLVVAHTRGEVQTWQRTGAGNWQRADTLTLGQPVTGLFLTANGKHLAIRHRQQVTLWDCQAKRVVFRTSVPAMVSRVSVSPGGKWLAVGYLSPQAQDQGEGTPTVQLWDVASGKGLPAIQPRLHSVLGLPFSSDERLLACACLEGISVYRLPNLERVDSLRGLMAYAACFRPDDQLLAVPSMQEDVVHLWPFSAAREGIRLAHPGRPRRVAFSPSGRMIATADDHSVRIWNLGGMAEKQVLLGHQGGVPGVAFSPDGTMLASVAKDRTLRLWDVQSGAERAPAITVAGVGQAVAFSPDGRFLATADYTAGSAQVWDLPARREVATLKEGFGSRVHSVAFSPNGHYLAVGAVPGLQIFDVRDLARPRAPQQKQSAVRPLTPGPPGDSVGYLCFSPDSKLLAWTSNQGVVHLWDMEARRELPSPGRVFARIQSLAFLPDSRRLIFLNRERVAEVWDVRGARRVHSFPTTQASKGLPSSYAMHISLRPDGRWLAASSVSGCGVNLWEVESGRLLLPLPEEKGIVWSLAWSPDGQRLAVSRSEGGLAIWDCAQIRRQLAELGADWSAGG